MRALNPLAYFRPYTSASSCLELPHQQLLQNQKHLRQLQELDISTSRTIPTQTPQRTTSRLSSLPTAHHVNAHSPRLHLRNLALSPNLDPIRALRPRPTRHPPVRRRSHSSIHALHYVLHIHQLRTPGLSPPPRSPPRQLASNATRAEDGRPAPDLRHQRADPPRHGAEDHAGGGVAACGAGRE